MTIESQKEIRKEFLEAFEYAGFENGDKIREKYNLIKTSSQKKSGQNKTNSKHLSDIIFHD